MLKSNVNSQGRNFKHFKLKILNIYSYLYIFHKPHPTYPILKS